ncbi:hypothetical protein ACFYPH_30410 [Micromonospora sp. NPDC005252]|uniref:hypothetical protein n=1 Tax=Micromonospora sp. NPDC005252 TaxID=3364228 RepID=UPI00368B3CE1
MNPDVRGQDLNETLTGVLDSVAARVKPPVVDLVSERLGAGESGRLTQLREAAHRLSLSVESMELICPSPVVETGRSLADAALSLFDSDGEGVPPWDERLATYKKKRTLFVRAARRDIVRGRHGRRRWQRKLKQPTEQEQPTRRIRTDGSSREAANV